MERGRIDAALARIAEATGRIDACATKLRQLRMDPQQSSEPGTEAVAAALSELDALLKQLQS